MTAKCDLITLQRLANQLRKDSKIVFGLNPWAMMSCAVIIDECIGAPVMMPTREDGVKYADEYYKGDPYKRAAFNHGVKWAVEQAEKGLYLEDIQSVEVGK